MSNEMEGISYLDTIGELVVGVDKATHEIVIIMKTPVGMVSTSVSKERALALGVALVRYSGKTFRFKPEQPPVVGPPPESRQEKGDAKASSDTGGGAGPGPDLGESVGGPADPGPESSDQDGDTGQRAGGGQDRDQARGQALGFK